MNPFKVTHPEDGQKLFQFLARHCDAPQKELHRWIRTGQVRINSKRSQAFDRIAEGDIIRIPPFAKCTNHQNHDKLPLPQIVAETEDLLVFNKPFGLPTHPGTGHSDSLATRLATLHANFCPTPIHRLDRDTSGLLLVAKNYHALRHYCEIFAEHKIIKEYLTWVEGQCPWEQPVFLEDCLAKSGEDKKERMRISQDGRLAQLTAKCLEIREKTSLLHIQLYTGRTHQIRAQLAERGYPLIGDTKYGGSFNPYGIKLHAFRLSIENHTWMILPSWTGCWRMQKNYPLLPLWEKQEKKVFF